VRGRQCKCAGEKGAKFDKQGEESQHVKQNDSGGSPNFYLKAQIIRSRINDACLSWLASSRY